MYPTSLRREAIRLVESGLSLNATSKLLGVSRAAIRDWRDMGIHVRSGGQCPIEDSLPLDGAAYAALLGYYLGDGCISTFRGKHVLRVACDASYPRIIADVSNAIVRVKLGGRVFQVPAPGCFHVQSNWKHWPCLFPQHGLGRKHERTLTLEDWQRELIDEHPIAFLRGLFHSDGCRFTNWATREVAGQLKRYEYGRWMFSNNSADIMRWCQEALDLLGVRWTMPRWNCLSVARRADVALLDELIGPKS